MFGQELTRKSPSRIADLVGEASRDLLQKGGACSTHAAPGPLSTIPVASAVIPGIGEIPVPLSVHNKSG
jgi:hypothetical protein